MKVTRKNQNYDELKRKIRAGFESAVEAYDQTNRDVISEPRDWGSGFGVTHRSNGEVVVGGYRNIVDLGNLKRSQEYTIEESNNYAQFTWTGNDETPAVIVHEGAQLRNGNSIPARRWTEVAAREGRLAEAFKEGFDA